MKTRSIAGDKRSMTDNQQEWRQDTEKKPTDVISWLLKAKEDGDAWAPPGDLSLYDEGRLVIVAGRSVECSPSAYIICS